MSEIIDLDSSDSDESSESIDFSKVSKRGRKLSEDPLEAEPKKCKYDESKDVIVLTDEEDALLEELSATSNKDHPAKNDSDSILLNDDDDVVINSDSTIKNGEAVKTKQNGVIHNLNGPLHKEKKTLYNDSSDSEGTYNLLKEAEAINLQEDPNDVDKDNHYSNVLVEKLDIVALDEENVEEVGENKTTCDSNPIYAQENAEPSDDKNDKEEHPDTSFRLDEFVEICKQSVCSSAKKSELLAQKIPLLYKLYTRSTSYTDTDDFKTKLVEVTNNAKMDPKTAIIQFSNVFNLLRENENKDVVNTAILDKLYKLYRKVNYKIKKLEVAEVDFGEEDDSSYMKMQRYRDRACKIGGKIRQIEKGDPNYGMISFGRLDFARSQYPEFNKALNKKFHDRRKYPFPTYLDVDKCIRKCVKQHNMSIPELRLVSEIRFCFKHLGELIKRRRQTDLATVHFDFLQSVSDDPARSYPEMNKELLEHNQIAENKINEIFEKYSCLQESGETPALSEDSDDSHRADSSEDEKEVEKICDQG